MKIKKIKKKYVYNLINYTLLNLRIYLGTPKTRLHYTNLKYLQGIRNKFCIFELLQTKIFIKKFFKIIYQYHYHNFKILFIGFPESKKRSFLTLFKKNNHYAIPIKIFTEKIFANKYQIVKQIKKNLKLKSEKIKIKKLKILCKIFEIRKTPNLIVLYSDEYNFNNLKFIYSFNIPTVVIFNSSTKSKNILYKVPCNLQQKTSEYFWYFSLKSILTLSKLKQNDFFKKKKFKKFR